MESWEEAGMTRDEYDKAMAEMDEVLGDGTPSEAEMDEMFLEQFNDNCKHGFSPRNVYGWLDVRSAYDAAQTVDDTELAQRTEANVRGLGYPEGQSVSVPDWIDSNGRKAAYMEGMNWDAVSRWDGTPFEQQPFDKMLAFRHDWGDEWSKRDNKLMNQKILDEWEAIQQEAYEGAMKSEEMEAIIDSYEYRREQDGINGDEPDIPWYEARDHGFGKSREELEQEAADYGEKVGREYEENRDELFERVYETDRQFDRYDGGVTPATYRELGDEYEKFYRDKMADYAESKMKAFSGIDLSRSAAAAPQSEVSAVYAKDEAKKSPERTVQRQVPAHFDEMLNSVEHGVSNPDYDFDEKD